MSLYRCLSCAVRNRVALEKLVLPVVPIFNNVTKHTCPTGSETYYTNPSTINSHQVSYCRSYSKKAKKAESSSSSSSDSDADGGGKKGRRGQSAFWRRKMRTHHMALDINKDGVVSWDDFEVLIKNFASLGILDAEQLKNFNEAMRIIWEEGWGAGGDPYAFISSEQFLNNMDHVVNAKDLRKKCAAHLPYFFMAVDYDSSGEISVEEYKTFCKCLNLPEEHAIKAFAAIDENGDGRLSKKEFIRHGRDFFLSEDERKPSQLFWGPLAGDF